MNYEDHYFELFGMALDFNIAEEDLRKKYIQLQRQVHPDRFVAADDLRRELAAKQSARINRGYDVLKNPTKRAHYLLLQSSGTDALGERTINNSDFLMEQMRWREALEEISNRQQASAMEEDIRRAHLAGCEQFAEIWNNLPQKEGQDFPKPNDEEIQQLSELVQRLQYLDKLVKELAGMQLPATDSLS